MVTVWIPVVLLAFGFGRNHTCFRSWFVSVSIPATTSLYLQLCLNLPFSLSYTCLCLYLRPLLSIYLSIYLPTHLPICLSCYCSRLRPKYIPHSSMDPLGRRVQLKTRKQVRVQLTGLPRKIFRLSQHGPSFRKLGT